MDFEAWLRGACSKLEFTIIEYPDGVRRSSWACRDGKNHGCFSRLWKEGDPADPVLRLQPPPADEGRLLERLLDNEEARQAYELDEMTRGFE